MTSAVAAAHQPITPVLQLPTVPQCGQLGGRCGAKPQPGFTGWNALADDGCALVRRPCGDGRGKRDLIFQLGSAMPADEKRP
jgi:hypothetical protein